MIPANEVEHQAEGLRAWVRKGGDAESWFRSKDFTAAERAQIKAVAQVLGKGVRS